MKREAALHMKWHAKGGGTVAFKQPRVPEYREADGAGRYIRSLVLFLKDFCMECWVAVRTLQKEGVPSSGGSGIIGLPKLSVNEDGHLICTYAEDPPPLSISADGHLIYTYEEG